MTASHLVIGGAGVAITALLITGTVGGLAVLGLLLAATGAAHILRTKGL